ncbi:MAG: excinuclease ABC subunit UvrB [Candidatus Nealsonbacteria bacterium DGGOD1a]|nr:MAG: excinuclease ABC subunit UvrB [Candidatus Nealsonbacteria bacterium DGGOD1a]
MRKLKIESKFKPRGDQPQAIEKLSQGIKAGFEFQTLLGVTGSGKTYTMAKVIEKTGRPTLVISPNKTLAAQLYEEFKGFFPNNQVSYFVSYYDYYQPEAYIPATDTYIEKDSMVNQEIDRLRHEAVQGVLSRRDTIIVASVSCIYNLGKPETYLKERLILKVGDAMSFEQLFGRLLDLQYERNDYELACGRFRKRMNFVDVWLAGAKTINRIEIVNGKIIGLAECEAPFGNFIPAAEADLWPAKFWMAGGDKVDEAIKNIKKEMEAQIAYFKKQDKLVEAERIRRRTEYDISLIRETGWCHGIENYSRHLDFRQPDSAPYTLLDYFPDDYLLMIDESHITVPQIHGMQAGDFARKQPLINYGFRLPSAIDNRPLKYDEFLRKINQTVFVSATPGDYEKKTSKQIAEQIVRPTYLLDPRIEVRATENQIDNAIKEIEARKKLGQRTLCLTITKRLSEALADHLKQRRIKAEYLHSEIKTLARPKILADLRKGKFDVLVGINLLREGLDLPEVSLIIIFDADKEGFLRDETSLVQIMGRASRHPDGLVVMYADNITGSMRRAMEETDRRRKIQDNYNKRQGINPQIIYKEIKETLSARDKKEEVLPADEFIKEYQKELTAKLDLARRNLQFEKAARIHSQIQEIKLKTKNGL